MTEMQNTETRTDTGDRAACGVIAGHKAHRYFDDKSVSRPCGGDAVEPVAAINHRAPLAPGEIRMHEVGERKFTVMHVAGGSYVQACEHGADKPSRVLKTSQWGYEAIDAYADAIEQAESDAIDALDDADGPSFDASGAYLDGEPVGDLAHNLPMGADMALVTGEGEPRRVWTDGEPVGETLPTPGPGSLSALLDAYGEAMSKGATCLVLGRTAELVAYAGRADELKAEILARFGGER